MYAALSKCPGLQGTLFAWCDPRQNETGPLSFEKVVSQMAADSEVRDAVRRFLSGDGPGFRRDSEIAPSRKEELAWALVEVFAKDKEFRGKRS